MIAATRNLYKNAYSGLTHRMWLLSLVMLINRSGTMVLAYMTLYCQYKGFSIEQGGLVVAVYGIGAVAGAMMGGKLSDVFGFYNMQFAALFCGGIMFMVLGQMESYTGICLATFLLAAINESFRPANSSAIAHYSNAQNRTQSFSLVRLAINLGWGVGAALGGILAHINYHLLFWVDGSTNIFAAILLLIILPRVSLAEQRKPVASLQSSHESAFKDKVFLRFLFFTLLFAICFFQLFTTIPIFFKNKLGLNEFWIGIVMAGNGLIIALFEMILVFTLEGKKPYLLLMSIGCIFMAISFVILNIPFLHGFILAFCAMIMITLAEMLAMPFMNSYYIARSGEKNRGQYAGLYTMAWSLAQVLGSSLGAFTAEHMGFFNLWIGVAVICLLASAGYYSLQQKTALSVLQAGSQ